MMKKLTFLIVGLFLTLCLSVAQTQSVRGTVTDETGEPVAGVSVIVKGTTIGIITDVDGNFSIQIPENVKQLTFSFLGYESVDIAVAPQMQVTLKPSETSLDEVVVVGYGIQKKVNLTGAVAAVDGAQVASLPNANVLASLQGLLPGVAVLRSGGQPGSETSGIRIRGMSSTGTANALILVDGVEGNLTLLNPYDIENISVLKDAAASAIYGARAAAGVVLVTTKKGAASKKVKISYNGSVGINAPTYMPERVTAWEEQNMINLSRINASVDPVTGKATGAAEQDAERTSWVGNPNYNYRPNGQRWEFFQSTNWMEEGLKDFTVSTDHSVSASGGSGKTDYYMSAGYHDKEGLLKYGPDGNSRTNLRLQLNTELSKYVSVNFLGTYQGNLKEQSSYGSLSVLNDLYTARGRQPVYNPEEDTNYAVNPYNADLQRNAIDIMKNSGFNRERYDAFIGKAGIQFKNFVQGLTVDVNVSRKLDYYNQEIDKRSLAWPGKDGQGQRQTTGTNSLVKTKNFSWQDKFEGLLNYDKSLGVHNVHVLLGASYEQYNKDEIKATANNLLSNDFFSFNFYDNALAANSALADLIQPWKMASLFGRLNYSFNNRYLFEANFRYDGSSRLDPSSRWDLFPSFSAGWRVSEETWFDESLKENISNLKLRASWGELGNSSALSGYFPYLGLITNKDANGNVIKLVGNPVYYQREMASKDITWEVLQSTNAGVDLGLFDGHLNMTADYYWKRNKNMMANMQVGHLIGVSVPAQNIGELKTWGWEISANWNHHFGDLRYQIGFNIDDSQNELVKYTGANVVWEGTVERLEGYPLNTVWGYKTDGYWSSRQEYLDYKAANPGFQSFSDNMVTGGDVKYLAQGAQDHTIGIGDATPENAGDLVYLGTTNGRYLYGLNLSAQWRGFDFSALFQGVGKRTFLINAATIAPLAYSYEMPWTIHRDYWTEDNPDAFFPRIINQNTYNYKASDKWAQNGAYIRLKNIQLGYTVPLPGKILQNLRFYIAGTDVWEHTEVLDVFDPEVGNDTQKSKYYPFFRTWTTGINLTF
ncbi:MAG: TonB-dependent receptor [Dysgonamonadaceae bacterium]|jgi:TonB-linked SusC/RagA family outer membrane protein|nr:TonB-dependent receptor [Dysgonamonadaceae bacterium]